MEIVHFERGRRGGPDGAFGVLKSIDFGLGRRGGGNGASGVSKTVRFRALVAEVTARHRGEPVHCVGWDFMNTSPPRNGPLRWVKFHEPVTVVKRSIASGGIS